jgi:REP element-mobilizing transposase RayT
VHVTLRAAFRPLRSQHVFPTVCLAIRGATEREPERFRIVHFSVQWDHVHLVVEARDERALSSGIRSVAIRVARYVNQLVIRRGRFWADRWHGRALTSPRAVRNVLVYVFGNFRKHALRSLPRGIDVYSSALQFDGWREFQSGRAPPLAGPHSHAALGAEVVVGCAKTWLGRIGWRRLGLLRIDEAPRNLARTVTSLEP